MRRILDVAAFCKCRKYCACALTRLIGARGKQKWIKDKNADLIPRVVAKVPGIVERMVADEDVITRNHIQLMSGLHDIPDGVSIGTYKDYWKRNQESVKLQ